MTGQPSATLERPQSSLGQACERIFTEFERYADPCSGKNHLLYTGLSLILPDGSPVEIERRSLAHQIPYYKLIFRGGVCFTSGGRENSHWRDHHGRLVAATAQSWVAQQLAGAQAA